MSALIKYSLLTFPIASIGLGVWQLKRLEWKKGLLYQLEHKLQDEPIDLLRINSTDELKKLEYIRVKAIGRFDQDTTHQLYLKPRQLVVNREAINRGRTAHQSNIGVNIVTPFQIEGTDLRILVNRGWLATKGLDNVDNSSHLGLGPKDEPIELTGILRLTDTRPRYGLKNNEAGNEWQVRDVEAMSKALKTAPIFVDADESLSPGIGPIGGQTQLNVRNEHLNYAITWFSLAIFCYIMWYSKYGKRSLFTKSR